MRICVYGLGEAGAEIAVDLVLAGAEVNAFDPADRDTPSGVHRFAHPAAAVDGAEVIISLTAAGDSTTALEQALSEIPIGALYADFSTAAPSHKRDLYGVADRVGVLFTDVALMGTVPGRGIATPAIASGPDARAFAERMAPLGMNVNVVGPESGLAATHKLLRSVFVKGLAAVAIESMEAAHAAGLADETWRNIVEQITAADESFLRRIIGGSSTHGERRRAEMASAAALLDGIGIEPIMTRSTVAKLDRVILQGVPPLPDR